MGGQRSEKGRAFLSKKAELIYMRFRNLIIDLFRSKNQLLTL